MTTRWTVAVRTLCPPRRDTKKATRCWECAATKWRYSQRVVVSTWRWWCTICFSTAFTSLTYTGCCAKSRPVLSRCRCWCRRSTIRHSIEIDRGGLCNEWWCPFRRDVSLWGMRIFRWLYVWRSIFVLLSGVWSFLHQSGLICDAFRELTWPIFVFITTGEGPMVTKVLIVLFWVWHVSKVVWLMMDRVRA